MSLIVFCFVAWIKTQLALRLLAQGGVDDIELMLLIVCGVVARRLAWHTVRLQAPGNSGALELMLLAVYGFVA
jgi:hypothetical protein